MLPPIGTPFQVYVVAPLAVTVAEPPSHILTGELTFTLGVIAAIAMVLVAVQVLVVLKPVTVYVERAADAFVT